MNRQAANSPDGLNRALAWLLGFGTAASCGLIAVGMMLTASKVGLGSHLTFAGIALLIALPTLRVATVGAYFLIRRDLDFALIAAIVLAIIVVSTLLGIGSA